MKRFLCIALIFLMLVSLCACRELSGIRVEDPGESAETETPENSAKPEEGGTPNNNGGEEITAVESSEAPSSVCTVTLTDADYTGLNLHKSRICTVDKDGMKILITFGGDAGQVRLCAPVYDDDFNFAGTGTVLWTGGDMKAGSQVGLRVFIPDVLPNVALCYIDAQGEHCYGIFQSGKDGSLMLIDLNTAYGNT